MKGKIGLSLFGLPFFAVGPWMLWSIASTLLDTQQMLDWQATPAELRSAGYSTSRGDDSNTYEAYASYIYNYVGQAHSAQRVGSFIALASLYMLCKSLDVYQESTTIVSVRRFLGIPLLRRRMDRHRFARFRRHKSLQTQSGGKHVIHYSLYAVDQVGNELLLGEGFSGESDTDAAKTFIAREFNLQPAPARSSRDRSADTADSNFLAEDS